jgi:hypothetical protein
MISAAIGRPVLAMVYGIMASSRPFLDIFCEGTTKLSVQRARLILHLFHLTKHDH